MDLFRIRHTLALYLIPNSYKRAQYCKKHKVFQHMGDNCMVMFRKIPLYPKLISFGNNVWVASQVTFVPHDVIHYMLNGRNKSHSFQEFLGCIDIKDNVFIGANSTILPNVTIGKDTIIAASTLVNKSIPGGGVYAGVPAKYICSFEEFIEKRKGYPDIKIERSNKGGLSERTVEACWERFQSLESLSKNTKE